jgi:hypothetical protein
VRETLTESCFVELVALKMEDKLLCLFSVVDEELNYANAVFGNSRQRQGVVAVVEG